MGAVYVFFFGLLMAFSGGWFVFDGVRDGHIEFGGARSGVWSAELRGQPIQFGCIALLWLVLGLIGGGAAIASVIDMDPRYYPMVPAVVLLPWALVGAFFNGGNDARAYLRNADATLRRAEPGELEQLQRPRQPTALHRVIREAAQLRLPQEPKPQPGGYRQRQDLDKPLLEQATSRLMQVARGQQWRLRLGIAKGLIGLLPMPWLGFHGARVGSDIHGYVAATVAFVLFLLNTHYWQKARKLLLRAPAQLAEAAVAGGTLLVEPESEAGLGAERPTNQRHDV